MEYKLILYIIVSIIFIIAFIKIKYELILFLPLFYIIYDIFYIVYGDGAFIGSFRNGTLLILSIAAMFYYKKKLVSFNWWLSILLIYFFILIHFSSNYIGSLNSYINILNSIIVLPLSYLVIKDIYQIKKLNITLINVLIIFILTMIMSSYFHLGRGFYESEFFIGGFEFSRLYTAPIIIILLPAILPLLKRSGRISIIIISTFVMILLIVTLRRTAIIIPVLGYVLYFIFSDKKSKTTSTILFVLVLILVTFPLWDQILQTRVFARSNIVSPNYSIEHEARFLETQSIIDKFRLNKSMIPFGNELFNSTGHYWIGKTTNRPLHVDYNIILYGSGVTGLLIYILFYMLLYKKSKKIMYSLPKKTYYTTLKSTFYVIYFISIVVSFSGGMHSITFRAIMFIYMGAILGFIQNSKNRSEIR